MGLKRYPDARKVIITTDCSDSNGSHSQMWKTELQKFTDETGLEVLVRHFPPGTSKWNKIEHRLFSFISMNWKGRPLESLKVIVNLIGSTTNRSDLKVECSLDTRNYEKRIKVSDEKMEDLNLFKDPWGGGRLELQNRSPLIPTFISSQTLILEVVSEINQSCD